MVRLDRYAIKTDPAIPVDKLSALIVKIKRFVSAPWIANQENKRLLIDIKIAPSNNGIAIQGADTNLLILTISADNLSTGIAGSVFIAYLSSLTNTAYTATQYALFSSLMTLPGKFLSGFSGLAVEAQGFAIFFTLTALLGLPAILLVLYLIRKTKNPHLKI